MTIQMKLLSRFRFLNWQCMIITNITEMHGMQHWNHIFSSNVLVVGKWSSRDRSDKRKVCFQLPQTHLYFIKLNQRKSQLWRSIDFAPQFLFQLSRKIYQTLETVFHRLNKRIFHCTSYCQLCFRCLDIPMKHCLVFDILLPTLHTVMLWGGVHVVGRGEV